MQFSPTAGHRTLDTIEFNKNIINSTDSIKFLAIIIESSLTWRKHIDYINCKLNSLGYMIRSLTPALGMKKLNQIYFSYVHSVLDYVIIFWGNSSHRSVFTTQKRIVRIIMRAKERDSCREMFSKLGILTL
jgi:hypothetical protein